MPIIKKLKQYFERRRIKRIMNDPNTIVVGVTDHKTISYFTLLDYETTMPEGVEFVKGVGWQFPFVYKDAPTDYGWRVFGEKFSLVRVRVL